ncbi:MAG: hypothetical protein ACKVQU_27230 [Burkholderiales bacterium]
MQPIRILLVEDDDADAEAVERGLRRYRIDNPVINARDGAEALQVLRADPALERTIVLVLTSSDAEQDRLEVHRHRIAGYFDKAKIEQGISYLAELLARWPIVNH